MIDYPLPGYAAAIWTEGETIWLAFPPSPGHSRGHKIHVANTVEGMKWALRQLRDRENLGSLKLGMPGCPAQAEVPLRITEIVKVTKSKEVLELEKQERKERSRAKQRGHSDDIDLEALGL